MCHSGGLGREGKERGREEGRERWSRKALAKRQNISIEWKKCKKHKNMSQRDEAGVSESKNWMVRGGCEYWKGG